MNKDIWLRVLRTFIAVFGGIAVPEAVGVIFGDIPLNSVWTYLTPIIMSAIAAGLSAAWNVVQQNDILWIGDTWKEKSIKTFFEAFLGILIPGLVAVFSGAATWTEAWGLILALICSALAAGITALWNYIRESMLEENSEA